MRTTSAVLRSMLWICILPLVAGVALAQESKLSEPFPGAPAHWEQLSSAGQMRAYMIYLRDNGLLPPETPRTPTSPDGSFTNPLVNNPALDATAQKTQSETTISLAGGANLISSYNDSGSFLGGVNSFTGYSTSSDSGATWTDRGIVPLLGQQNFGDPILARDNTTGRIFLSTLSGGAFGMNVYRSTDNGVTFSGVADGAPGAISGNTDKEWIAVDNAVGAGQGNVYHIYRDFGTPNGVEFTRSTDQGVTFSAPIELADGAAGNVQGAHVAVGADHAVYATWYDSGTAPDSIRIRKSINQGASFGAPVTIANLVTTGVNGSLNIPAGYRSSAFPQLAVNPAAANNLYVVWPDLTVAGGSNSNIWFKQSTDGGATWGAAVQVNTDAGTHVQAFPTIAVKPDGTGLGIMWYDNRSDPANVQFERWARLATISGTTVTFGGNVAVSDSPSTPVFGVDPVVNTTYMGDYDQATADNAFYYDTFVDTRLGDQDVRFVAIPVDTGIGVPIINFVSSNPTTIAAAQNSCTDLFLTVVNDGTVTATGLIVTLSSSTPGVTILDSPQPYGDVAAGAQATNAVPFQISIDGTFACGANIVIDATTSNGDAFSFSIGTQGVGYTVTTANGVAIVPGTANVGNSGDDVTTNIAIPFPFPFYAAPFAAANVSSNGNLQFSSNNAAFTNDCPLPDAAMNNLMAPHWDDLRTDAVGSGIFTSISGVAPDRIFNIEWRGTYFSGGAAVNFEIRLHETSGVIDYVYGALNGTGASATIGLQKADGSGGASDFTQFSCNTATLATGLQITYTPVAGCPQGTGACAVGGCTLTCPANISGPTDSGVCSAVDTYAPPVTTGTCGTVTCTPPSGSTFPLGTTTITCSSSLGGASCSFTDTVVDQELPVLVGVDQQFGTDPGVCVGTAPYTLPTVTDNCDAGLVANCAPPSGSQLPLGANPIACTATDSANNVGNGGFNVTIVDDEAPTITCPADIEQDLPPGETDGTVSWADPTVGDNCAGVGAPSCVPPSGSIFPGGETTPVDCSVLDGAGNQATCAFNVTLGLASILEIPTASNLGLAALALLLAGAAFLVLRRNG